MARIRKEPSHAASIMKKKTYQLKDGRWVTELKGKFIYENITAFGSSDFDSQINAQVLWGKLQEELMKLRIKVNKAMFPGS